MVFFKKISYISGGNFFALPRNFSSKKSLLISPKKIRYKKVLIFREMELPSPKIKKF